MMPRNKKIVVSIFVGLVLALLGAYILHPLWLFPKKGNTLAPIRGGSLPPPMGVEATGKVLHDTDSGKEYISNQLIVEFDASVPEEDALALISSLNGKMLQRFTAVPLFLVMTNDAGDGVLSHKTLSSFKQSSLVKNASLNFLTTK